MMQAFLDECRQANLSDRQLRVLESVIAEDEGWIHLYVDGNYAAAEAAYRRSAALGGDRQLANLVDAMMKQSKYREAIEPLTEELSVRQGDPGCTMHRGTEFDDMRWRRDMQRVTTSDRIDAFGAAETATTATTDY